MQQLASNSRMETAYGDPDYDLIAAQVPSPLFKRTATAYGDADFDLFAAQVPSPLFRRIGAAHLEVLVSRESQAEYAAAALEASVLESDSPRMPPVRFTGQVRPYHRRVIMSSSGSSSSPSMESSLNDSCGICGDADGDLMYCQGGGGCTAAVHAKCLRSRQVFKFQVSCRVIQVLRTSHLFRGLRNVKGKIWRCELCDIARKAHRLQLKNSCMCV